MYKIYIHKNDVLFCLPGTRQVELACVIQEHGSAVLCGLAWVLQGPGSPAVGLPHQRADRDGTKTAICSAQETDSES